MANFILYSDAIKYCERYGFKVPGNISPFGVAEALLRAYKAGSKKHNVKAGRILPEFCQDCKDEFGHPDNCIGCDHV